MMLGLNSGSTNDVDSEIDFGIVCDNGMIRISEHGVVRDEDFGSYYPGETFQVSVLSGVVAYYKDGAQALASLPVVCDGPENWVKKIVEGGNLAWTNPARLLGYFAHYRRRVERRRTTSISAAHA